MKRLAILGLIWAIVTPALLRADDPLPSWNAGPTKRAIIDFVRRVTNEQSPHYVAPADRIATFDNDGCLWSEKPVYFQLLFAMDRIKQLAPEHPEWKSEQPFKAVLEGDQESLAKSGMEGVAKLVMASHAGMTTDQFAKIVKDWLSTARHPRFKRPYTDLVFQPMLELLTYPFTPYVFSSDGGGVPVRWACSAWSRNWNRE